MSLRILAAAALLALTLPVPWLVQEAQATDVPTASNVCAGESGVLHTAIAGGSVQGQLRVNPAGTGSTCLGGSTAHWPNWAGGPGTWNLVFDSSDTSTTASLPDGDGTDSCVGEIYRDNTATVQATLFSGATCPSDLTTFSTTLNTGTYRIRIRIVQTNELVENYNIDSDSRAGTSLWGGAIRVGLGTVALTHAGYPAGSTHAYTVAGETAGVNIAHSAIGSNQGTTTVQVASIDGSGTAIKTQTVSLAGTSGSTTFAIDEVYAASSSSYGATLTVPSSATSSLTGVRWTHIHSATAPTTVDSEFVAKRTAFYTIDPRVTATHLLQADNTFSTPPMSENDPDDARYSDSLGYVATRFTNARSEGLSGASFQFSSNLYDTPQVIGTTEHLRTGLTIGTQGGEAGWGPLRLFNDGAPTGSWTKAVDVTAPGNIDADTHLVTAAKTYTINTPVAGGEGMGDPLKVFVSPLAAAPGGSVRFAASEAFLDGRARTMNAADTLVYLYDPSGDLIVNGGATAEIHAGIYQHTHTLAANAEEGAWTVVIETSDPITMDPVTTSNTFIVGTGADLASSLQDHRDRSLETRMHDPSNQFHGLGFDGFVIFAVWLFAFFVMLYLHKVFGAFAAFLGLFDAVTDILPGSWQGYTLLFILALWLEAIVGDKIYQKWLEMKEKRKTGRDA